MTDVRRTRHYFTSHQAYRNVGGRFEFVFREPIFNIASIKLKKFILANFAGIANSPYYFVRTDCISLTRDTITLNGVPTQIVSVFPYAPHTVGLAVDLMEEDDSEMFNNLYILQNLYIELLDYNGNVINPPDPGWSFCVELQIIIKTN